MFRPRSPHACPPPSTVNVVPLPTFDFGMHRRRRHPNHLGGRTERGEGEAEGNDRRQRVEVRTRNTISSFATRDRGTKAWDVLAFNATSIWYRQELGPVVSTTLQSQHGVKIPQHVPLRTGWQVIAHISPWAAQYRLPAPTKVRVTAAMVPKEKGALTDLGLGCRRPPKSRHVVLCFVQIRTLARTAR